MKKIYLYKVKSFAYTPFDNKRDLGYLNEHGIFITQNLKEADILISQNEKHLKKYYLRCFTSKTFLVWTLEPRFNTSFTAKKKRFFGCITCHFMNIYTGNVFCSGLSFHSHLIQKSLRKQDENQEISTRKVAALMSYYNGLQAPYLLREGVNIDLIALRSEIALEGHKKGIVDIYGKNWPENVSKEDSREGDWKTRKQEILENYWFNLCFENTIAENYITEKIWDSIENYCLPIYYGKGTNIYTIFPKASFIDFADFNNIEELFDFNTNISTEEYYRRLNKCIAVYNSISENGPNFVWKMRKESLDKIVEKVYSIQNI